MIYMTHLMKKYIFLQYYVSNDISTEQSSQHIADFFREHYVKGVSILVSGHSIFFTALYLFLEKD